MKVELLDVALKPTIAKSCYHKRENIKNIL